ncbi:MAG: hypothetical protein WCP21_24755, partial [Armatimonadota bacterium]
MHNLIAELPNLFTFQDGAPVLTPDDWRRRRAELQELILDLEYGHLPPAAAVRAEGLHPTSVASLHNARHNVYRLNTEGGALPFWFYLDLLIPEGDGPFPVVINGDNCWRYLTDEIASEVLGRGYVLASFNRTEIVPDDYRLDRDSALYNVYPDGDFSALAAWAWGYHRAVDFLLTQEYVNPAQIAVVGHSRGGKTVLLAGATDERIALTAPNNSGSNGAGCFRWQGEGCERLADGVRMVPYWYSAKMPPYVDREQDLPFDQHSLKALVAPRALLSTEALADVWADPTGTYWWGGDLAGERAPIGRRIRADRAGLDGRHRPDDDVTIRKLHRRARGLAGRQARAECIAQHRRRHVLVGAADE